MFMRCCYEVALVLWVGQDVSFMSDFLDFIEERRRFLVLTPCLLLVSLKLLSSAQQIPPMGFRLRPRVGLTKLG